MSAHFLHGGKHRAMLSLYQDRILPKNQTVNPVLRQATPAKICCQALSSHTLHLANKHQK